MKKFFLVLAAMFFCGTLSAYGPTFTTDDFLGLRDTPDSYTSESGNCVAVNGTETGLEFVTCGAGGSGDVTAVGDCTSGACFDGTQGTTLTFENAGGDGTLAYNGTSFTFSKNIATSSGGTTIASTGSITLNSSGTTLSSNGTITLANGTATSAQLTSTANSLTSGTAILGQSSSNSMTGRIMRASYTGTSSGNALEAEITNASASGITAYFEQYGTGNALQIDDVSGDTTPFIVDASGNVTVPGNLILGGSASASDARFMEPSGSGSNYSAFKAQAQAGDVTYTLPAADGSANQILKTNGSGTLSWTSNVANVGITLDGGGSAITTGLKGYIEVPYDMTITGWTILADTSGSIVVDVWKDTYANYPPTVADTIAGTEKPTISASTKGQDLTLSSWTTSVTAGDIIAFNVDSAATVTRVQVIIRGNKS